MNVPLTLGVDGVEHRAILRAVCDLGVVVCGAPPLDRGVLVSLAIESVYSGRIATCGRVARRLRAGELLVEVASDDVLRRSLGTFARGSGQIALPRRRTRATREMLAPVLSSLSIACRSATPLDRPALAGSIREIGMVALLAWIERTRRTGRLVLEHEHATVTIDLVAGAIVGAESTQHARSPWGVLQQVLGWQDGWFELRPCAGPPRPGADSIAIRWLLIEHAREHDEAGGRAAIAPA